LSYEGSKVNEIEKINLKESFYHFDRTTKFYLYFKSILIDCVRDWTACLSSFVIFYCCFDSCWKHPYLRK